MEAMVDVKALLEGEIRDGRIELLPGTEAHARFWAECERLWQEKLGPGELSEFFLMWEPTLS
jgi:hypothetical protein